MAYKSLIQPFTTRPKSESRQTTRNVALNSLMVSNFHSTTILLIGAVLQGLLILLIPRIWTLLPSLLILLARSADTLAITFHFKQNPYLEGVLPGMWTTIIPDREGQTDTSNVSPADEKIAILLLSAKINHPLGFFAPYVKQVGTHAQSMINELDTLNDADVSAGFLGQTSYTATDSRGAQKLMMLSYWRSIEDIHAYANGPRHLEAWKWWNATVKKDARGIAHVGIGHEIFEAPRGKWEAVAANFQPTGIGATTFLKKGDKFVGGVVDDCWVSPVVQARGRLRTSKGRLNWASNVGTSRSGSEDDEKEGY